MQKTLNGLAPQGSVDLSGFQNTIDQHDENYKELSHQLAKERGVVQNLYREFDVRVNSFSSELIKFKMETNEGRSGVTGDRADNHKTGRGYLPLKGCMPKKFIDKMEEWRKW